MDPRIALWSIATVSLEVGNFIVLYSSWIEPPSGMGFVAPSLTFLRYQS